MQPVNAFHVKPGDCAPYHLPYVDLVRDKDIGAFLKTQRDLFLSLITALPEEKGETAYAPGKWTVKQVIQHVIDTERIFAFRLLALARGEQQPIPGFEQDDYANTVDVTTRSLQSQCAEFKTVRDATMTLVASLTLEELQHRGMISGFSVVAGALPYVIAGHVEHHIRVLDTSYGLRVP